MGIDLIRQQGINTGGGNFAGRDMYLSPTFQAAIDSIKPMSESTSPNVMHFLCGSLGFYGREKETGWLDQFCEDDRTLLFTVVYGIGGIGKSKLLHEYVKSNSSTKWHMCFLTEGVIESLLNYTDCNYPKNLLVVVDYAARYAGVLGKWLAKLSESKDTGRKLRVVLIERAALQEQDVFDTPIPWLSEFYGNPHQKRVMKQVEYEFLQLGQIGSLPLARVIEDYAAAVRPDRILTDDEKQSIIQFASNELKLKEDKQSPLIVLLVTDAFLNGSPFRRWNLELLVQNFIERLCDSWFTALCNQDKELYRSLLNLLTAATAMRGLDLNGDIPERFSEDVRKVCSSENGRAILENATGFHNEIIAPIEPDYIGEFIVLDQLQKVVSRKERHEAVSGFYKSREFPFFMYRCIEDYAQSNVFWKLFDEFVEVLEPLQRDDFNVVFYAFLVERYSLECRESKSNGCTEVLRKLYEIETPGSENKYTLASVYSMNLVQLTVLKEFREHYGDNLDAVALRTKMDKVAAAVSTLKKLYDAYKDEQQFILFYAEGLSNFSYYSFQNAKSAKDILEKLYKDHYKELPEIAVSYAMALNNYLMRNDAADNDSLKKAENAVEDLSVLYHRHVVDPGRHKKPAIAIMNMVSNRDLRLKVSKQIEKTVNMLAVSQRQVAVEYAKGLNNIIAFCIKTAIHNKEFSQETVNVIQHYFDILENLYNQEYHKIPEIEVEYAKGMVNSIPAFDFANAKIKLNKLKTMCEADKQNSLYPVMRIRYLKAIAQALGLQFRQVFSPQDEDFIYDELISLYNEFNGNFEDGADSIEVCFLLLLNMLQKSGKREKIETAEKYLQRIHRSK